MATKFSKHAFQLAQQTEDIYLQLMSLSIEQRIACICDNGDWIIKVARKARDIAGILLLNPRLCPWLQREARAHLFLGNLSRALDLCTEAEVQLTLAGMEDSDRYLGTLDLRAQVHYLKSEYSEASELYGQIVKKTSPSCSPLYHAHGLCAVAEMNIRMESDIADIVSSLNAAETVYLSLGSPRISLCSWLAAELKLYRGDTDNARVAFLECLSKSRVIYPDIAGDCLAALADPAHKMSGPADTFRWAVVYFVSMQKAKKPAGRLQALRRLADVHMFMDDDETALHLFQAALKGGTKMGMHRLRAECMVGIGEIMLRRGDLMQAMEIWGAAHPLFVRSSRMKDAASVKNRLEMLCRKDNSHSVRAIRDGPDESTDSVSFDFKRSESPSDALESSFKKLKNLSAPLTSLSLQVEIAVEPGTSHGFPHLLLRIAGLVHVKNSGAWDTQVEDNGRGEGAWKARMCAVVPSMCGRLDNND
ncbi:hypothetical protein DFH08DRAFT_969673 [Mycena albidolilacea]|uniref:Uncharacterized protein n=1 Tax=Mycena albidolilacea TaxID=1033008 RepID=A0AAD6ZHW9_9AGAR|nr:hypothetical protein DFH08DRAFT_969673 [Mycena albidolilacea]